jgi:hypothetical protein
MGNPGSAPAFIFLNRVLRTSMLEAKTYRQYAAECRRMAKTMKEAADRKALLQIAEAWEKQAQEAERLEKKS